MAYTFGGFKIKSSPNDFSGLVTDGNRVALTGASAGYTQSFDASAGPVYSPITNGSGSGVTLKVPQSAVSCTILIASTDTALVGEDSTFTYGMFIPTATYFTYPCTRQQYIYILPSSGTNTIYFQFNMV